MNDDVAFLLGSLRGTALTWIADEIEAEIAVGRIVEKTYSEPGKKRKKSATTIEDYSEVEQLEIALHCLTIYVIVSPHVWSAGNKQLVEGVKGIDGSGGNAVAIADAEGQLFTPFTPEFAASAEKLYQLLREAWPGGHVDFDERFHWEEENP